MSLDAMKQALAALENSQSYVEFDWVKNQCGRAITALRAAIEQTNDWDEVEALRASLREHMAEIHRLRAAIEQAQEPVAWVGPSWLNPETRTWESESFSPKPIKGWIPLYTAPRQWQGLTEQEIKDCEKQAMVNGALPFEQRSFFARAIEAKLKEKNARPIKPLTDEEIDTYFQDYINTGSLLSFADGVRFAEAAHGGAIEAKLKEKNT